MSNEKHLLHLREKYVQLSRQYLREQQAGKKITELKDLVEEINDLLNQISALEQQLGLE